mgnify:CR=1 FL=1
MSDLQISQLESLPQAELADVDLCVVVDNSASETKKIPVKSLVQQGVSLIDAGSIPGSALGTLGDNTVVTDSITNENVTNEKLENPSISVSGIELVLGGSYATPQFDLADATNYPASSLIGTVSNAQLSGSISNDKLVNSSITLAGVTINLGDTLATPALNLSNATSYPTSSLTGTITNAQLAGSIENTKILNSSITIGGVVFNLGDSKATPELDIAKAKNYPTSSLSGTITNAQLAGSIQGSKISEGTISSTELGTNSVTAVELANLSVDTAALIDSSVTDAKITAVSGTKVTAGSLPATALNSSNLGTGLAVTDSNLVIDNTVTAGTATKVTFSSAGLITGSSNLAASDLPIADSNNVGGVSIGGGLSVSGTGALSLSNSITAATVSGIQFNAYGQIVSATNLASSDLPLCTSDQVGGVQIATGGGLSIDGSGAISTVTSGISEGTYQSITVNSKGVATAGSGLTADLIPLLPASKINSGTLDSARIGASSISGPKLSDASTTLFGGPDSNSNITTFPSTGDFKGQRFWDEYSQDEYIWTGASWTAVTTTAGELTLLGTYSAAHTTDGGTAQSATVASVTTEGSAAGLTAGSALPAASATNKQGYLVVVNSGTGESPAPTVTLAAPDYLLSDGSNWKHIDVSNAMAATAASQVTATDFITGDFTDITGTVQASLQNLANNKLRKTGGDMSGALRITETGSLVFEGSSNDSFETTLSIIDPDADYTLNLPKTNGTLISSGDSDTVTSTMVDGSLTSSNLAANASIAFTQLASLTSASILIGNSSGVVVETTVTGDISITDAGVTSIGTGKITDGMISGTAAIDGSKVTASSTTASGTVQLNDSTNSTSTSEAATANALKTAYDLANTANTAVSGKYSASGGEISGNVTISSGNELQIKDPDTGEGVTEHYTAFKAQSQSSDIIYTLPATGPTSGFVLKSSAGSPNTLEWAAESADDTKLPKAGGTMTGAIAMGTSKITGLGDPTDAQDAVTKSFLDSAITSGTAGSFSAGSASNLNAGTLGDARFPSTLPALNGSALTDLNAANIASGTIDSARVPTLNQDTTGSSGSCTGDAAGLTGTPNITVGTIGCGVITGTGDATFSSGKVSDSKGDLRSIPAVTKNANYQPVADDAGKVIYISGGAVTIDGATFSPGDVLTIINNSGTSQAINRSTTNTITLWNTFDATNADRTIAGRGIATVWFASANEAFISGVGVT